MQTWASQPAGIAKAALSAGTHTARVPALRLVPTRLQAMVTFYTRKRNRPCTGGQEWLSKNEGLRSYAVSAASKMCNPTCSASKASHSASAACCRAALAAARASPRRPHTCLCPARQLARQQVGLQ